MSYYFPHDYDAMTDDKVLQIRAEFGLEGYALFWMCLETMAKNDNSHIMATLIGGLSVGYGMASGGVGKDTLRRFLDYCVEIGLFQFDSELGYYSNRMLEHKKMRETLSISGKKGAENRWAIARQSPGHGHPNAKKRKEKKRKEKEITSESEEIVGTSVPTPSEITNQFFSNVQNQQAAIDQLIAKGYEPNTVNREMRKFVLYWTELNQTGKKQRWQMEKVFEVNKRLATWLGKVGGYSNNKKGQQWSVAK